MLFILKRMKILAKNILEKYTLCEIESEEHAFTEEYVVIEEKLRLLTSLNGLYTFCGYIFLGALNFSV